MTDPVKKAGRKPTNMTPEGIKRREYYQKNRERILAKTYEWREKNKQRHLKNKRDHYHNVVKLNPEYKEQQKARRSQNYKKLKKNIIEHYGGECVCCGEKEREFLTIEHINGDGKEHRDRAGRGIAFYTDIIKNWPEDLTILCFNCNWASRNGRTCPHRKNENG